MKGIIIPYYPTAEGMSDGSSDSIISVLKKYPNVPIYIGIYSGNYTLAAGLSGLTDRVYAHYYLDNFQKYGAKVLIYLETTNNTPTIENFKSAVDIMLGFYPNIDGFFLDEYANAGPGSVKPISWYTEACQYIRGKGEFIIVGNTGGGVSSGWYTEYPNSPDILSVFESPLSAIPSAYSLGTYYGSPTRNAIIPYTAASSSISDASFHAYSKVADFVYFNSRSDWVGVSNWLDRQANLLSFYNDPPVLLTQKSGIRNRLYAKTSISNSFQLRINGNIGCFVEEVTDDENGEIRIHYSNVTKSINQI